MLSIYIIASILLIVFVLFLIGKGFAKEDSFLYDYEEFFGFLSVVVAFALLFVFFTVLVSRVTKNSSIREYESFKTEIEYAYSIDMNLDKHALYGDVVEWNTTVKEWQRMNKNWNDIWVPDEVDNLELIRLPKK